MSTTATSETQLDGSEMAGHADGLEGGCDAAVPQFTVERPGATITTNKISPPKNRTVTLILVLLVILVGVNTLTIAQLVEILTGSGR